MIQQIPDNVRTEEGAKAGTTVSFCIDSCSGLSQEFSQLGFEQRERGEADFLVIAPQSSVRMPCADLEMLQNLLDDKTGLAAKHLILSLIHI